MRPRRRSRKSATSRSSSSTSPGRTRWSARPAASTSARSSTATSEDGARSAPRPDRGEDEKGGRRSQTRGRDRPDRPCRALARGAARSRGLRRVDPPHRPRGDLRAGAAAHRHHPLRPEPRQSDREGDNRLRSRAHALERRCRDPAEHPRAHRGAPSRPREGPAQESRGRPGRGPHAPTPRARRAQEQREELRRDDRRGQASRDAAPEADRPVHPCGRRDRPRQGEGDPRSLTPGGPRGQPPLDAVPRHLAIVMDGNRRWARKRHLPAIAGHRAGVDTIRRTLRAARERGVEYLTLFSFSTENWSRDRDEGSALMALLEETIRRETKTLVEDGVRLMVIGRLHELSDRLQKAIAGAIMATAGGKRGVMTLAFNYGGRAEIIDAVKKLVRDRVAEDAVDEHAIATRLYAPEHPDPDLLIRTGGELRVSNFLLWEVAYAEMWATEVLWPDFSVNDLDQALNSYAHRERRFGR